MSVVAGRQDQAHDRGGAFRAALRPCKEPVLAPQRLAPYLVLAPIIINGHSPVIVVALQCRPAFQAVIQGIADGRTDIALFVVL